MARANPKAPKIRSSDRPRDDLAAEVESWESGARQHQAWHDAPEAVVRHAESVSISIRFPQKMLEVLRAFAARERVGYQVLIKRWLDDRIAQERDLLVGQSPRSMSRRAPHAERMVDSPRLDGPHYQIS